MRTQTGRYTRATVLALLCSLVLTANAQTGPDGAIVEPEIRRYTVEVILFRYSDSVATGDEVFPPDPPPELEALGELGESDGLDAPIPEFGDLIPVPDDSGNSDDVDADDTMSPIDRVALTVLPKEQLQLQDLYEKLQRLDAYEPVMWAGWTQGVVERDLSPEIALRRIGNAPPQFDGTLQLYLSRFLHLVVNLSMTPGQLNQPDPVPTFSDRFGSRDMGMQSGLVHLRIDEDRIMKNGDLRYFDHPRFGLLAKVTRIETSAAPLEIDTTVPVE